MPTSPETAPDSLVAVAGAGYTGRRVLDRLPPARGLRLGRPDFDLDAPDLTLPAIDSPYALLYTVPPSGRTDGDERLGRLLSLRDLTPTRIVYLSTTGVYGNRDGRRVDESSEPAPGTKRALRRLDAESRLEAWCEARAVGLVVLRVPGIYGPGRLGLERIAGGAPVIREEDASPGNRIHADDLADCCLRALSAEAPPGTYNVGDGDHRSGTWFTKTVARMAGLGPPAEITRARAEAVFDPVRLSFLAESRIVDTTRMREILGFSPRYTNAEDGIRASLLAERAASR